MRLNVTPTILNDNKVDSFSWCTDILCQPKRTFFTFHILLILLLSIQLVFKVSWKPHDELEK